MFRGRHPPRRATAHRARFRRDTAEPTGRQIACAKEAPIHRICLDQSPLSHALCHRGDSSSVVVNLAHLFSMSLLPLSYRLDGSERIGASLGSDHHGENTRLVVLGNFRLTRLLHRLHGRSNPRHRHIECHFRQSVPRSGARSALSEAASPQAACNTILQGYNYPMRAIVPLDDGSHSYAGTGYANPNAVTQIATGQSTTTYSYDQNGNLVRKTTDV
jgi:YD repeat-containing protein